MATQAQIRTTAAENLGILGEGETLPSYETGDLNQAITETYNELRRMNLVTWASTDNVPDEFARSFAMMVAESRAVKYQVPTERYQRIKGEAMEATMRFRALQAKQKIIQTPIEYF